METKPRWKKMYEKRVENGLCPRCGETKDRDEFYCENCKEKRRIENNKRREFLRDIGICPYCGKAKLVGKEKICLECAAYFYEKKRKRKTIITEEKRLETNNKSRDRYRRRVKEGICVSCGKFKPVYGRVRCKICLEKNALSKTK